MTFTNEDALNHIFTMLKDTENSFMISIIKQAIKKAKEEEKRNFKKFKEILLDAVKSNFKGEWHSRYFEEQMFKAEQQLKTQKEE